MKVIVGLGNPGRDYEMTRHNLGFMLIDRLFQRAGGYRYREEASAEVAEVNLASERALVVKPQTYMNLSGNAVRPLLEKYGDGEAKNLIVTCDDVALPFGMIRIRPRGSAGGQKGLQSIIDRLGTEDFARLRLGIKPEHQVGQLKGFVLSQIPKKDYETLNRVLDRAADAVEAIMKDGVDRAMQIFNERVKADISGQASDVGQQTDR